MKKSLALLVLLFAPVFTQVTSVVVNVGAKIINFNHLPKSTVTFGIGSATADANGNAILPVSMGTSRMPPAGVQFDINYTVSDLTSIGSSAGPVVTAAGKTLSCVAPTGTTGVLRCLASSVSATTIANGIAAQIAVTVNKPTTITLANVVASSVSGTGLTTAINPASASVGVAAALANVACVVPPWDAGAALPAGTYNIEPGETTACTATLTQAAPTSGFTAAISAGTSGLTLPASVVVSSGATSATFQVTGQ